MQRRLTLAVVALTLAACTPAVPPGTGPVAGASVCRGADAWVSVPLGIHADQVVVADFDGDGLDDLAWNILVVFSDAATSGAWFALNKGDGTFAEPTRVDPQNFTTLEAVDVDKDGHPDLVLTAGDSTVGNGGVFIYLWRPVSNDFSSDTFAFPAAIPGFDLHKDIGVELAVDLTGDGNIEFLASDIVQNGGEPPVILHGSGAGTFDTAYKATGAVTSSGEITGFAATDLDGDGLLDLVMGHQDDTTSGDSIALQNADGTFAPSVFSDMGGGGFPHTLDVDGDGVTDLVWGVALYRGQGGTAFAPVEVISTRFVFVVRDLDGDGNLDLVGVNGNDFTTTTGVDVTYGTGPGAFATTFDEVASPAGVRVAAGDFDGQRGTDLVVSGAQSEVTLLLSRCVRQP